MKEKIDPTILADTYLNQRDLRHDWFDLRMLQSWFTLQPGAQVLRNHFRYSHIKMGVKYRNEYLIQNNQLFFSTTNDQYRIDIESVPTTFILIQFILGGMQRRIGLVKDLTNGAVRIVRPQFINPNDTQDEQIALETLNNFDFPVPTDPQMHQLFFPWNDAISYRYVPGKSLHEALEEKARTGHIAHAQMIMFEFGQHLKQIWQPLFEGRLPNGLTYRFPDNVLGNWIYSPNAKNVRRRFVRIDVLGLSNQGPIGFKKYEEQIRQEIIKYKMLMPYCNDLLQAYKSGTNGH